MYATPFIDETFDIYNCHNYTLSIRCAPDGFSFSIFDRIINKFIVLAEYELNTASAFELKNETERIINSQPILQQKYKQVKISFVTDETTLVPATLFNPEEIDSLFSITFQPNRNNIILFHKQVTGIVELFSIPKIIYDLFRKLYPNCVFFSPATPLFHYLEQNHNSNNRLLVWISLHNMYLIFQNDMNTQLLNTFFVKNETDCLYYLLNTVKQLQGDSKTEIILMGKIDQKSELVFTLKKYFEKVNFAHFSHQYAVSYTFFQEPEHFHLASTELALCE